MRSCRTTARFASEARPSGCSGSICHGPSATAERLQPAAVRQPSVRASRTRIRGLLALLGQVSDGSIGAVCCRRRPRPRALIDLGAWLPRAGLAVAGPAPFEYQTLERIAEVNRRGVWGFQVDQIIRR